MALVDLAAASTREFFIAEGSGCVLWLLREACPLTFNDRVIEFVREVMAVDPKYKRSKQVHGTIQAGVYHVGKAFHYRNHHFYETPVPPLFDELRAYAERATQTAFDTVLFKVFRPGESLAKHQDVDGSDMSVACFTFASDTSQLCRLVWYWGEKSYTTERFAFTPEACSMWFMSGSTNRLYSHRVLPAEGAIPGGLRVSVTFRQSDRLRSGGPVHKEDPVTHDLQR